MSAALPPPRRLLARRASAALSCAALPVAAVLVAALGAAGCSRPAPPDVVVVVLDTLRADRTTLFDPQRDTMPWLAQWARGAVLFERAFAPSSWTAPSTASLFSGVYPTQHGVDLGIWLYQRMRAERPGVRLKRIPDALETLPELLQARGYRTFGIADNPNISHEEGFASGFDRFRSANYRGAQAVNAQLAAWREEIAAARPAFVYLHYMDPHHPYHPRAGFAVPPEATGRVALERAAYDAELRWLDAHLREAFALLGVDERTLVVVAADHGEELYERGEDEAHRQHGFQLYEELTHVVLALQPPGGRPARARVGEPVSLVDVLPTVRELIGAPASAQDAGRSLVPAFTRAPRSAAERAPRPLFASRREVEGADRRLVAVRLGAHKYLRTTGADGRVLREELYDLDADPGERSDLAAAQPAQTARLRAQWERFARAAPRWQAPEQRRAIDAAQAQRLRALGYVEREAREEEREGHAEGAAQPRAPGGPGAAQRGQAP